MKYLVVANVLSEPTKAVPDARVVSLLSVHEADCMVDPIILDAMITATALEHDLTVVTRNAGDFRMAGVWVLDPFT